MTIRPNSRAAGPIIGLALLTLPFLFAGSAVRADEPEALPMQQILANPDGEIVPGLTATVMAVADPAAPIAVAAPCAADACAAKDEAAAPGEASQPVETAEVMPAPIAEAPVAPVAAAPAAAAPPAIEPVETVPVNEVAAVKVAEDAKLDEDHTGSVTPAADAKVEAPVENLPQIHAEAEVEIQAQAETKADDEKGTTIYRAN